MSVSNCSFLRIIKLEPLLVNEPPQPLIWSVTPEGSLKRRVMYKDVRSTQISVVVNVGIEKAGKGITISPLLLILES